MLAEFDVDHDSKITFHEYMTTICGTGWVADDPPTHGDQLRVVVAVDGSDVAVQAFNYAARLLKKRDKNDKSKNDKLVIYHVTNPERYPDMSANFRPDVIKEGVEHEWSVGLETNAHAAGSVRNSCYQS